MVERLKTLDETYSALAHPIRRTVLERLRSAPSRVTEVAAAFDVSLAATSRHLQVLQSSGLIAREIRGRDHILSARGEALVPARDWLEQWRDDWNR